MTPEEQMVDLKIPVLEDRHSMMLDLCQRIGVMLMEVGAETSRVEDSIVRILNAYGYEAPSAIATPTMVIISFKDETTKIHTTSYRVVKRGNNLDRLCSLNQLSRNLCEGERKSLAYFRKELETIANTRNQPAAVVILGSIAISAAFIVLFRGNWQDFPTVILVSAAARFLYLLMERAQVNSIFIHLVSAFVATLGIELLAKFGLVVNPAVATIAIVMNFVPGLLLTNSIRETISGDFTSGMNKILETLLIAVVLAVGSGVAVLLVR